MRPLVIVVPGRLDTPTGGYVYDRRMAQGLSRHGWSVEVRELDDSFPHPTSAAAGACRHRARRSAEWRCRARRRTRARRDARGDRTGSGAAANRGARASAARCRHQPRPEHVGAARGIRTPRARCRGANYRHRQIHARAAGQVRDRLPDKIVVVEPGTARAPLARGSRGHSLRLLSVATLNPNQGA